MPLLAAPSHTSTSESVLQSQFRRIGIAGLVWVAAFLLTGWLWHSTALEVRSTARERFGFRVEEIRSAIRQQLTAYEQVLRGGTGLFRASETVTRADWRNYVNALDINKHYPGIRGIGYAVVLNPSDLKPHVRRVRAEGFPGYTVHPSGQRPEYTSIVYLEPFDWRNQRAFGYDMFSEPIRREAMIRARDSGQPSVSGKVILVQETGENTQSGFLMFQPVYEAPAATDRQHEETFLGYVYSPFRMNDLMQGTFGPDGLRDLRLEIFDGHETTSDSLMYESLDRTPSQQYASAFGHTEPFEVNGRRWTVRFSSLPTFDATIEWQRPRLVLFGGTLISLLLGAVFWSLSVNRDRARDLAATNRRLSEAKDAADAASQAKTQFLANVSHELRTPLTLILAPVEQLIRSDTPPTNWREPLERIQRSALLLLNRVNDILDYSKLSAGKLTLQSEALDVPQLVSVLAGDAAAAAERKGCTLTHAVAPEIGTVLLDPRHLTSIILNLLSNAIKFTPPGGTIHLEAKKVDGGWLEFTVTDTGIGIPVHKQPQLFQRFEQVDSSTTRQHGGTGLGLALVKELAELMGGSVSLRSIRARGTRFFVRLPQRTPTGFVPPKRDPGRLAGPGQPDDIPLRRARLGESSAHSAESEGGARRSPARSDPLPRVLIADDNAEMREYISGVLCNEFEVHTATNGDHAWASLQTIPTDLVVSDVMMPGLDGVALAARLKSSTNLSHIPIILVTARGGSEASAAGLDHGADDYLAKPFSAFELQARVRAALRMSRLQNALREKAREASVAMFANGVMHNLGNALNCATVSSARIQEQLASLRTDRLEQLTRLLTQNSLYLPKRLHDLPRYTSALERYMSTQKSILLEECATLRSCVKRLAALTTPHQNPGHRGISLSEPLSPQTLLEEALELALDPRDRSDFIIDRIYDCDCRFSGDRHRVLHILLNLLGNARDSLRAATGPTKRLQVRADCTEAFLRLQVADSGVGVGEADLSHVFEQEFTTKGAGRGFGLHWSAKWAREMGGEIICHSEGHDRGATFVLSLPLAHAPTQR